MACSLWSEKEAKHYLKITLARRKARTEAARPSFPGDTSFTQGDSGWPMRSSYPFNKDISLSLSLPLSFSPHFRSLLLSLPLPLLTFEEPPKLPHSAHTIHPFGVALGPGGGALIRVTRSAVHAVRARLQTVPCGISAEITVTSPALYKNCSFTF